jgi:hypothetical protein
MIRVARDFKPLVDDLSVTLPYTNRPFALPIIVALYRDKKTCQAEGRHKTAAEIMCGLLAVLMRWFPERKLVFAGGNAYCLCSIRLSCCFMIQCLQVARTCVGFTG